MKPSSNSHLPSRVLGRVIHAFDVVDSTNDVAKRLAEDGAEEGVVILAEEQRKGKGRLRRSWISPRGGIWMSIVLRPRSITSEATFITIIAGIAVARTLCEEFAVDARLKWPNDVLIGGKKVSGILSEISGSTAKHYVIVGIGVNANFYLKDIPGELRPRVTTLLEELKKPVDLPVLTLSVLRNFESRYFKWQNAPDEKRNLLEEWRKLSTTLGAHVKVTLENQVIEGLAEDIAEDGALMVRLPNGEMRRVLAGDVFYS